MVTAVKRPAGESRGKVAAGPNDRRRRRASPRPYRRRFGVTVERRLEVREPSDVRECRSERAVARWHGG
jgi:hypothetical protein